MFQLQLCRIHRHLFSLVNCIKSLLQSLTNPATTKPCCALCTKDPWSLAVASALCPSMVHTASHQARSTLQAKPELADLQRKVDDLNAQLKQTNSDAVEKLQVIPPLPLVQHFCTCLAPHCCQSMTLACRHDSCRKPWQTEGARNWNAGLRT